MLAGVGEKDLRDSAGCVNVSTFNEIMAPGHTVGHVESFCDLYTGHISPSKLLYTRLLKVVRAARRVQQQAREWSGIAG